MNNRLCMYRFRKQGEFADTLYLQKSGLLTESLGTDKVISAEFKLCNSFPTFEDVAELVAYYKLAGIHSYDTILDQIENVPKLIIYKRCTYNNYLVYDFIETCNANLGADVYKDANSLLGYIPNKNGGIAIYEVTKKEFNNPGFTSI